MLEVPEAQAIVLRHARPLAPQPTPLTPAALGLVLAEDMASDLDMPPYDKAMMDGYAVRSADLAAGAATLDVIEEIIAGRTPTKTLGPGQAARIMTGAPVPAGADRTRGRPAGGNLFDDGEGGAAALQVGGPHRVAVHERLVVGRHVEVAGDVLGQDQAERRRR